MTQHVQQPTPQEDLATIAKLIKGVHIAMLTFRNAAGHLHAQPMTTQEKDFDGVLWFVASKESDLVRSVEQNMAVNVSYSESGRGYVSLYGNAELVTDQAKLHELWNDIYQSYFPGGEQDPNVQLIKVTVHGAHYWESDGKLNNILQVAKTFVTGEKPHFGEGGSVKL